MEDLNSTELENATLEKFENFKNSLPEIVTCADELKMKEAQAKEDFLKPEHDILYNSFRIY